MEQSLLAEVHQQIVVSIGKELLAFKQAFKLPQSVTANDLETDADIVQLYESAEVWLTSQAMETFCDFIGLRIFGVSFLRAFAYLLAPNLSGLRSESYPNMVPRAANLLLATTEYQLIPPPSYVDLFKNDPEPPLTDANRFLVRMADLSLNGLVQRLIKEADSVVAQSGLTPSAP